MKKNQICSQALSKWLYANINNHKLEDHFHDTHSIGIILSGVCDFSLGENQFQAVEGDVVVFNPYQVHNGAGKKQPIEYHMLYPKLEIMQRINGNSDSQSPLFTHPIIQNKKLFEQIKTNSCGLNSTSAEAQDRLCEEITRLVLRTVPTESTYFTPPNQIFGLIGNVCQFIEGHLYSEITVAQIAEHFAITRCHLARVFKQKVGLSPNQYIRLLRLREAECLVEQGMSLVQISTDLLFSDQAHFSREFKRTTGMSPSNIVI